jgi:hypothetical protein
MKFKVSRTSLFNDEKPCEGSFKEKYIRIDERSINDPSKNKFMKNWYDEGNNHRVENGHIKRDFVEEGWFVEIATLLKFIQFSNNNGPIIIRKFYHNASITEIEIYDDFRE